MQFFCSAFCWTRHRRRPFLDSWLVLNVRSWPWDLCFVFSESFSCRLKLRSPCWIDLHNDTVTVWDSLYVWLNDVFTNVILTRACFHNRFLIKQRFSESCRVERSSMITFWIAVLLKILAWTCWICQLWDLIDCSLWLKNESHSFYDFVY